MFRRLAYFLVAVLLGSFPAVADWRVGPGSEVFDDMDSAFGISDQGVHALGIACRDGAPFVWTQGFPAVAGANRQDSFQITVDGRAFTVTGEHAPPDGLWTGAPPTGLVEALRGGVAADVAPPGQPAVRIPLRGSSRTITTVLADCGEASRASDADGDGGSIGAMRQLIATACGGGYDLAEGAELTGLLDGDDKPDIVLDWGGVTCDDRSRGRGAGFCGAALCTIEIALTETRRRQQVLGLRPEIIDRGSGRMALKTTTQGAACGGPAHACDVVWRWTGQALEAVR